MAASTVAEKLVAVLERVGVRRVYGVVGDSLNPVVDAIRRSEHIEWLAVRNEEAGAFAASAEAQLTGQLAVCAGSCGPGNTHLLQGIYDAHRSRAPVLAIASHITSEQVGTGFFQETHPERVFVDASAFCEVLSTPEQAPRLVQIAVQHAIAARDTSVLVLPGDVAEQSAPDVEVRPVPFSEASRGELVPLPAVVEALAGRLNAAERVMLFCGSGVQGAHDEVLRLAAKLLAPVGHTLRGKEWIQYDNPYDVGMSGLLGYGACYDAMWEADVVVLLGTDFPYDGFLPQARTVQIDADATHLGRRSSLDLAVHGNVRATLRALEPLVEQKQDRRFLDRMLARHAEALERVVGAYTRDIEHHRPIHPEWVASALDDAASDDAIFTVDTGMCNVWAARYLTPNGRRRVIGSFVHGSMANALPQAIGAQLAYPDRQVISVSGDGGLGMLLGELLTVRQHDLPVKIVVFNNGSLGMVKLEMLVAGLPEHGTDIARFDYAQIAHAIPIHAQRVEDPAKVPTALREVLDAPGPALLDVVTDPNALSIPPHVTAAQLKGFALATGRTVLAGGVGKMLELARANLRNIPRP
jgi:pyruvate dehydrogenase (quinone)